MNIDNTAVAIAQRDTGGGEVFPQIANQMERDAEQQRIGGQRLGNRAYFAWGFVAGLSESQREPFAQIAGEVIAKRHQCPTAGFLVGRGEREVRRINIEPHLPHGD